jgi:hypothetical protein
MEAVLFVLLTGIPWRALPRFYGAPLPPTIGFRSGVGPASSRIFGATPYSSTMMSLFSGGPGDRWMVP